RRSERGWWYTWPAGRGREHPRGGTAGGGSRGAAARWPGRQRRLADRVAMAAAAPQGSRPALASGWRGMTRAGRYRLDFRGLMAQCESNYARLLPLMRAIGERDSIDLAMGGERPRTLNIRVLERAP